MVIKKETLQKLYFEDMLSMRDIAKKLNISTSPVRYWMKKHGLKFRNLSESGKIRCRLKPQSNPGRKGMPKNPNYGKDNHSWKGGYIRKDGYRLISVMGEQRLEHRYIWEKDNGQIPEGFQVHHINGDKLDNRIENMQVMSNSDHQKLHFKQNITKPKNS